MMLLYSFCNILWLSGAVALKIAVGFPNVASSIHTLSAPRPSTQLNAVTSKINFDQIGKANLDWPTLGFSYRQTNSFISTEFKDGKWGPLQSQSDPMIKVHVGSTALHYGQAAFEGLKAFHCQDGKVRIFRPNENARRMAQSANRICMPEVPQHLFIEAVKRAVAENLAFLPPYGTGGALYIRPLLFGTGARVGLQPSDQYTFLVLVLPVADYYKGGWNPVSCVVVEDYDRAAPRGVGNVKVAGNYAADILANMAAKKKGFPIALYLDSKTNQYIEEFSTSNFIAIDTKGAFVTPSSGAILKSITNKSLMELATEEKRDVQVRNIHIEEVERNKFNEIGACGTAVVLTPVDKVVYKDKLIKLGGDKPVSPADSILREMYNRIRRVQYGEEEDVFGWLTEL